MANTALMTSTDGINWTPRPSPFDPGLDTLGVQAITYGDGVFTAFGYNPSGDGSHDGMVCTSPDGVTWTARTLANTNVYLPNTIAYSAAFGFVIGGVSIAGADIIETSPTGTTWTDVSRSAYTASIVGVAASSGAIVATAGNLNSTSNSVITSTNGTTWTAHSSSPLANGLCAIFANSAFVLLGYGTSPFDFAIMTSTDGATWTSRTVASGFPTSASGLPYRGRASYANSNYFLTFGPYAMSSPNATSWTNVTITNFADTGGQTALIGGIVYNGSDYVAIGTNGSIIQAATSPDGTTWTASPQLVTLPQVRAIASSGSLFVAGGDVSVYSIPSLTLTSPTTTSITANWSISTGAPGFTLQYRPVGSGSWTQITGLTYPTASQVVTGLIPDTEYEFQIEGVFTYTNASGVTGFGPSVNAFTSLSTPSTIAANSFGVWRANVGINWNGMALVGDGYSGIIGLSDFSNFTEYGNPMQFLITSPPIQNDRKRIFLPRVEVDVEAGVGNANAPGNNPTMWLDWSKDGGVTWGPQYLPRSMGVTGNYTARLRWINLGQSRAWVLRLTCVDPVRRVIIGVYLDEKVGLG